MEDSNLLRLISLYELNQNDIQIKQEIIRECDRRDSHSIAITTLHMKLIKYGNPMLNPLFMEIVQDFIIKGKIEQVWLSREGYKIEKMNLPTFGVNHVTCNMIGNVDTLVLSGLPLKLNKLDWNSLFIYMLNYLYDHFQTDVKKQFKDILDLVKKENILTTELIRGINHEYGINYENKDSRHREEYAVYSMILDAVSIFLTDKVTYMAPELQDQHKDHFIRKLFGSEILLDILLKNYFKE
jgi:hypothetical protein